MSHLSDNPSKNNITTIITKTARNYMFIIFRVRNIILKCALISVTERLQFRFLISFIPKNRAGANFGPGFSGPEAKGQVRGYTFGIFFLQNETIPIYSDFMPIYS